MQARCYSRVLIDLLSYSDKLVFFFFLGDPPPSAADPEELAAADDEEDEDDEEAEEPAASVLSLSWPDLGSRIAQNRSSNE